MSPPYLGCAFLAARHKRFPMAALEVFNGVHRPGMAIALFLFGGKKKVVKRYLSDCIDRPHMLEAYLTNPWRDSIDSRDILKKPKKIKKQLRRRIKKYTKFVQKYANHNTELVMTYTLEGSTHGYSYEMEKEIAKVVKEYWPYKTCSNGYPGIPGTNFGEKHGAVKVGIKQIVSLDGQSIEFTHRKARISNIIKEAHVPDFLAKNSALPHAVLLWQDLWQDLDEKNKTPILQRNPDVPRQDRIKVNRWLRNHQ